MQAITTSWHRDAAKGRGNRARLRDQGRASRRFRPRLRDESPRRNHAPARVEEARLDGAIRIDEHNRVPLGGAGRGEPVANRGRSPRRIAFCALEHLGAAGPAQLRGAIRTPIGHDEHDVRSPLLGDDRLQRRADHELLVAGGNEHQERALLIWPVFRLPVEEPRDDEHGEVHRRHCPQQPAHDRRDHEKGLHPG